MAVAVCSTKLLEELLTTVFLSCGTLHIFDALPDWVRFGFDGELVPVAGPAAVGLVELVVPFFLFFGALRFDALLD